MAEISLPAARPTARLFTLFATALITVGPAACGRASAPTSVPIPGTDARGARATVVEVVDGDTVDLRFGGGRRERVRLLGIDTPETVHPDRPVECFGPEASARTAELLPAGSPVLVQRDVEARDRFGRLLVYLWTPDGTFVNAALLAGGHARTLAIAPNDALRTHLSAVAASARSAGAGLWSACPPDDP